MSPRARARVVGITGHRRIPDDASAFVRTELARVLRGFGAGLTGVSSLAAGADQLFAEAVLRRGGRLHAVIPCTGYEATFADPRTLRAFRRLIRCADAVETLPRARPSNQAFLDAGRRVAELSQVLIAVWDGREARGRGGTAEIVGYARGRGTDVVVIWPPGITR